MNAKVMPYIPLVFLLRVSNNQLKEDFRWGPAIR